MEKGKRVGVIGASGWLGQALCSRLRERGWKVTGFSRSDRSRGEMEWRRWNGEDKPDLGGLDAIINLAGEAIDQRWSEERKKLLRRSRVDVTARVSEAMGDSEAGILLNASAIGVYGDRGDEALPESAEPGGGFLPDLCRDWEGAVEVPDHVRTVFLRTGLVLGVGGGAWGKMEKIFRLGIGGRLGSGRQWMPWIHIEDEIGAIIYCLEHEIRGPVNLVAPESVRNADFTRTVGRLLSRPTLFPAPALALRVVFGEFAREGLLASSRVVPQVLLDQGYQFHYPDIEAAMKTLV